MYIRQTLFNFENQTDHNTITVGEFNVSLLSLIDHANKNFKSRDRTKNTIKSLDLMEIYRIIHQ